MSGRYCVFYRVYQQQDRISEKNFNAKPTFKQHGQLHKSFIHIRRGILAEILSHLFD